MIFTQVKTRLADDCALRVECRLVIDPAPLLDREATGTAYRLIGVGVSNYAPLEEAAALDLADPDAGRRARLEDTIDTLRDKFGADAIGKGRGMAERLKTSEPGQGKEP